jgi:hypothetical protein
MMNRRVATRLCAVTLAMTLTACAGNDLSGLSSGGDSSTEERIFVASATFNECTPVRLNYADSWQAEQYALFQAGGRQMEMVYARTKRAVAVALDYQMPLEKMASTWVLNSGQSLSWGPLGRIDKHPLGIFFYRPYGLGAVRRPCFAFLVEWDQIYADPQGRPGKVLFGCYCGETSDVLADADIRAMIRAIMVCSTSACQNSENRKKSSAASMQRPENAVAAAGGSLTPSGNSGFPFRFARHYSDNGGSKIR